MYKFVVLFALFAAAIAEPEPAPAPEPSVPFVASPALAYSSSYLAPTTTAYGYQANAYLGSSPYFYSSPLAYSHYIKKRSAPLLASNYIASSPYYASLPYAATPYSTPYYNTGAVWSGAPLAYSAPAHFIKKRSVGYTFPSAYIPSTYSYYGSAPYAATYSAPVISSAPVLSTPVAYSAAHLIKKRSVGLLPSTYIAPTTYAASTSYFPSTYAAPALPYYSSAPLYSSPALTYSTFIKK